MTRVALVLNPVSARSTQALRAVEQACAAGGLEPPLVLSTTVERTGAGQAADAVAAGAERVVVVGGDGTVRAVAGGLADRGVVLGVVPVGTANLFARSAGLARRDLAAAARAALTLPGRPTDLGRAVLTDRDGQQRVEPFLVVVGVGHDADTLARLDPARKARLGWPAYVEPGLRRLARPGRPVDLGVDGQECGRHRVWSLLAVNSARLPLGARVVPGARLDDGLLHLTLVAPRHLGDWARVAWTGLRGRHTPHPALRYLEARTAVLRHPDPMPVQVDGDVLADIVEAQIQIRPGALSVARP